MKQAATRLALVTSGPTRHNLFARFPELAGYLGPIRATSPRTEARAAKVLGGGWAAAAGWSEVLDADVVVTQSPGPRLLGELRQQGPVALRERVFLACDASSELRELAAVEALGAIVVHLHTLDAREPLVALSGDNFGLTRVRRLLSSVGIRCLTIRDGAGGALLSTMSALEERIVAALREASLEFEAAGLRGPEARMLGVGAALRALRR